MKKKIFLPKQEMAPKPDLPKGVRINDPELQQAIIIGNALLEALDKANKECDDLLKKMNCNDYPYER